MHYFQLQTKDEHLDSDDLGLLIQIARYYKSWHILSIYHRTINGNFVIIAQSK